MRSIGIVRHMDEVGRLVLPKEIRDRFKIVEKDPVEIYVEGNAIALKKYEIKCIFCGDTKELIEYKDKAVCEKCITRLLVLKDE
ncbi:MAG: AbrB/MazE/SpoVT family DNA-binding domain-containing protein [Oscillospiraceae bacterium]|nr:AbrB/MazE/SpoVT family DNA-binding domain-containing protein [Oscillospiraceae bacterium]